ncbi:hypothetical protein AVEN_92387-1 [Araneus ventricosus]|uniref:DUF7041 domain-containing protein n=1 Tax=Araneus ventricosus TaxID=182803 RepID=A0A4Y2AIQ6_ARAVE|nr:hypothetical protein AVEN_92387-1 [Araneus ventricosus]
MPSDNVGQTKGEGNELSRVAFRAPLVWEGEPELWFYQLESQFIIAGITTDITKYLLSLELNSSQFQDKQANAVLYTGKCKQAVVSNMSLIRRHRTNSQSDFSRQFPVCRMVSVICKSSKRAYINTRSVSSFVFFFFFFVQSKTVKVSQFV